MNSIALTKRYEIFQQDLTVPYLKITAMGYVKTLGEAMTVCKVFNEQDKDVSSGKHTYIFVCEQMEGEQNEDEEIYYINVDMYRNDV